MSDSPPLALEPQADLSVSVRALRTLAKSCRSRGEWIQVGRTATAEEIAYALAHRRPTDCVGWSARTKLPCEATRIKGATTCVRHGGQLPRVKRRAERRLAEMVMPTLESQFRIATQDKNLAAATKAAADLMNRAGFGQDVEAKITAATRTPEDGDRVVVNIGFLANFLTGPGDDSSPARDVTPPRSRLAEATPNPRPKARRTHED